MKILRLKNDDFRRFETERRAAEEHCRGLFDRIDADGSGRLDKAEVAQLAAEMGLGGAIADPRSHLTLDTLISAIENHRRLGGVRNAIID